MPRSTTCLLDGKEISVKKALSLKEDTTRKKELNLDFKCIQCEMPVRPHREGGNAAAHFEHLERNPNCPLSDPER